MWKWRAIQQNLLQSEGRKIDQIKIETKLRTTTQVITQIEKYYSDTTECLG